ncbi:hypothetical protein V6N11_034820 [Hibiscus sabdariffa]|uniref:Secreted protein n=1 Tax=Hibiscus sabdariffa TaxID=183260 RepID=A0ABR2NGD9_9ROSI
MAQLLFLAKYVGSSYKPGLLLGLNWPNWATTRAASPACWVDAVWTGFGQGLGRPPAKDTLGAALVAAEGVDC